MKKELVHVWEEDVVIPTYEVGLPNKNPMFLEKRVYQGSSGRVYPYPIIDKISDEKVDKTYKAIWLENEYLRVMLLPEIGGRIQRAYDKTNNYDFVYHNEVMKPALVGLLGPWVSGGIEFNWPQHHRPTTFSPVDYTIAENEDGSKTVYMSEVDQMYGTKGMAAFTLHPGKAYIEIKGQLYNRTNMPQTFLWWANPAIAANDNTQSVFPPDVHAVMDHGKRAVSKFPIATGEYYKYNYGEGVDISRFKNIPVPTSYMAYHSDFDFVGGYDHGVQAGVLHVADHHISPGKKQWTWGNGDFGKAWDDNLTDENGPYIELMTGVFTDNQPDFTWLQPFEEKVFTQYFMPYKKVGNVKNASTELVLNMEVEKGCANICVYATAKYENLRIVLSDTQKTYSEQTVNLSPEEIFCAEVNVQETESNLALVVFAEDGREMLSYAPQVKAIEKIPEPALAALEPLQIATCEELLLTAQHLEQNRHATYEPDGYYLEGLKRDAGDARINTAWGMLLLRRGQFATAEGHFRTAVQRLTSRTLNPYDGEAHYALGLALLYQGRDTEAYDAFYKATWSSAQQEMAFYYLASISCKSGQLQTALEQISRSLVKNSHNLKARAMKALLLIKLGKKEEADAHLVKTFCIDPFAYTARFISAKYLQKGEDEMMALMCNRASSFIEVGIDLAEMGEYSLACEMLRKCTRQNPMLKYYEAYYLGKMGQSDKAGQVLNEACKEQSECFPNRLEDILVLEYAVQNSPSDSRAMYHLGNLWYDKKQYAAAQHLWEKSAEIEPDFPTVWRNLSICYFNKTKEAQRAHEAMEKAFSLDVTDARVFLELDQLNKLLMLSPAERMQNFENNGLLYTERDDLYTEYVTLLNMAGRYQQAYDLTVAHQFHPLEGAEGKIPKQYALSLKQLAQAEMKNKAYDKAVNLLQQALLLPKNLGEGKLDGAKDNDVHYCLGQAYDAMGNEADAKREYELACRGAESMGDTMYYYDQPADMIFYQGLALQALGNMGGARALFNKLADYGEGHIFDEVKIDFFAVSLPDLLLFEADIQQKNVVHCNYLMALGKYGLGEVSAAKERCAQCLAQDPAHQDALMLMKVLSESAA